MDVSRRAANDRPTHARGALEGRAWPSPWDAGARPSRRDGCE
jgi:hypothetical protein